MRDAAADSSLPEIGEVAAFLDMEAGLRELLLRVQHADLRAAVAAQLDTDAGLVELLRAGDVPAADERTGHVDPSSGRRAILVPALACILAIGMMVLVGRVGLRPDQGVLAASATQSRMEQLLADHPGGTQISPTEASYGDGKLVVTLDEPSSSSGLSADCPAGWFCFYSEPDYRGVRGKLSDCGWSDLYLWGWGDHISSVYYNVSSGSVDFLDHRGSGGHAGDELLFSLSVTKRGIRLVPQPNRADHVNHHC
ncbi:hypothetical protein F4553_002357 [Allocatelliglobosispora scoriae]|uniref:Uncharacterized protein n=1 Tax=Allocatelliglobosispora scoriae TaxID=643052 RepID=A0A841BNL1_9ACTN|nr:peptidase inhibitor family I36 protein [Allocatelliglobosispora scoriae]MBB5868978.1 hypothetical protein [Allocatelliglobosispora scoriae]